MIYPWRRYKCLACAHEGRPKMLPLYTAALLAALLFLLLCLWMISMGVKGSLIGRTVTGPYVGLGLSFICLRGLLTSRNGLRCRKCSGLLI